MTPDVGGVKKYGVSLVGSTYPFLYESDDDDAVDGVKEIVLRPRRSLPVQEHLAHVRARALIQQKTVAIRQRMADELRFIRTATTDQAKEAGYETLTEWITKRLDELTEAAEADQLASWEMTKDQVRRLLAPSSRDAFDPIMEQADPAHVNELLADIEAEVIERQREETKVAAGVDPTLPTPPSGSSPTPTSSPDSDSEA